MLEGTSTKPEGELCSMARAESEHLLLLHLGSFWRQSTRLLCHLPPLGAKPKQVSFSLITVQEVSKLSCWLIWQQSAEACMINRSKCEVQDGVSVTRRF